MSGFMNEFTKELDKMLVTTYFDDQQFKLIVPRVSRTDYEYDDKGRVSKSYSDMYGMNIVTNFEYDDNDNLIYYSTITNGNEKNKTETIKQYDEKNRIITSTSARYIESYEYTDDGYIKTTKDIEEETETTEVFKTVDGEDTLVSMEMYSIPEDCIVRRITSEFGDGWSKVSYFNHQMLEHSETIDTKTNMPIEIVDRTNDPRSNSEFASIVFKTVFTYDENNDTTNIKTYADDKLIGDTSPTITIHDGITESIGDKLRSIKYHKDRFNICEIFYEEDRDISYKMIIDSKECDCTLEKSIIKQGDSDFETIRISSNDYSIDMVDLILIDINIVTDGKKYEFGSDLHGSPAAYACVTTYRNDKDLDQSVKVEYTRNTVDDPMTNYLSTKVYDFIINNKDFKDILELAEVNYEELKKR